MQTAFKMAISGKCPAMTIFWLKTRAGWSEKEPMVDETEDRPDPFVQAMIATAKQDWEKDRTFTLRIDPVNRGTPDERPINL